MTIVVTTTMIVFDFVTGLIKSLKEKSFDSSIMREGLFNKVGSVLTIVFGVLIDYLQDFVDIGVTIPILEGICIYIVLMEIGSIIENLGAINQNIIPDKLKSFFVKLPERKDDNND